MQKKKKKPKFGSVTKTPFKISILHYNSFKFQYLPKPLLAFIDGKITSLSYD